jgi:hypothetical protein
MMAMTALSNIGIDKVGWDAVWRVYRETNNIVDYINWTKPLLQKHMDPIYYDSLIYAINNNYDIPHLWDSWSDNQLSSKRWLVKELTNVISNHQPIRAQLFGGWFGFPLVDLLLESFKFEYIENIDLDEKAVALFRRYAEQKGYSEKTECRLMGTVGNIMDEGPREWGTDLVINTSSEHMPPLPEIMKDRKYKTKMCWDDNKYINTKKGPCIFAFQSNNMFHIDDHINCVNSEDELVENTGLETILYKGSLTMPNGYERYMVIGHA